MSDAEHGPERSYDLIERTAAFGENVIDMLKQVPETALTRNLIDQLCRALTSVGANYIEADDAVSRKDFRSASACAAKRQRSASIFAA